MKTAGPDVPGAKPPDEAAPADGKVDDRDDAADAGDADLAEDTADAEEAHTDGDPPFSLEVGTCEHYQDAALYDFEYRRRRADLHFYRALATEVGVGPILELGCGTGRLLAPLLRDGRHMVGVDRSPTMLQAAAARVARSGRRADNALLLRADFRALGLRPRFPLVLCPFNTLQHIYTRVDLEAVFAQVRGALAPGGRFVFDVMNPDLAWLLRDPERRWVKQRFRHPRTGEALVYSTNHVFDHVTQINYLRIYYEPASGGGPTRTVRMTHRLFFPAELEALLHYNGFRLLARYGDFGWSPLETDSEQQVCVAEAR
jgi:SAM-dependent methyltransferase